MYESTFNVSQDNLPKRAKHLPQYIAALCATLGSLGLGTILGWSSPAGTRLMDGEYGFPVSKEENAWIGSMATLGAACICYPIGFIMESIGRKMAMLLLVIPFTIGWILIITATNPAMLFVGRFLTGIGGGAFSVTAPAYISEIAQDEVRGTLGTFFQLMITVGILYVYSIGGYVSLFTLSIACAIVPIVFGIAFIFMPETPYYLIHKNRIDDAKKSLLWLRGPGHDNDAELESIQSKIRLAEENHSTFKENFSKRSSVMAFVICMSLIIFFQFSGINAILFNAQDIFINAKANIAPEVSSIIVGVIQVVATLTSSIVIEKSGRIPLLLMSSIAMAICHIVLGVYFHLSENGTSQETLDSISWLPLVSLCIYFVAFSLGLGPIPWVLLGELSAPNIRAFIMSSAGTFNWVLAFVITTTFTYMKDAFGEGGVYWFFAVILTMSALFTYFVIPETKAKTNDQIQLILSKGSY